LGEFRAKWTEAQWTGLRRFGTAVFVLLVLMLSESAWRLYHIGEFWIRWPWVPAAWFASVQSGAMVAASIERLVDLHARERRGKVPIRHAKKVMYTLAFAAGLLFTCCAHMAMFKVVVDLREPIWPFTPVASERIAGIWLGIGLSVTVLGRLFPLQILFRVFRHAVDHPGMDGRRQVLGSPEVHHGRPWSLIKAARRWYVEEAPLDRDEAIEPMLQPRSNGSNSGSEQWAGPPPPMEVATLTSDEYLAASTSHLPSAGGTDDTGEFASASAAGAASPVEVDDESDRTDEDTERD